MSDAPREWFAQSAYRCRLAWGRTGARDAARRGDVVVVVDVLSFSTVCALAVARGALVYPCLPGEEASVAGGLRVGAVEVAVPRSDVPAKGRFSLSPVTLEAATPGTAIVIGSPNGAACARLGGDAPTLLVGALVNARACADAVTDLLAASGAAVTVVACGERAPEPESNEGLRFALEDLLGAGAILSALPAAFSRSPEAGAAEAAFRASEGDLEGTLHACGSGIELIDRGYASDVEAAVRANTVGVVPVLRDGAFRPL